MGNNNKIKTNAIQSRLDREGINKLEKLAEHKRISLSLLIRMILMEYVEKNLTEEVK